MSENTLKSIRAALKIKTQQELSEILGVKLHQIVDIERNKINMQPNVAKLLEEKFQINYKYAMTGEGEIFKDGLQDKNEVDIKHGITKDCLQELKDQFQLSDEELELIIEEFLSSESTKELFLKVLRYKKSGQENVDQLIGYLQGLKTKYE